MAAMTLFSVLQVINLFPYTGISAHSWIEVKNCELRCIHHPPSRYIHVQTSTCKFNQCYTQEIQWPRARSHLFVLRFDFRKLNRWCLNTIWNHWSSRAKTKGFFSQLSTKITKRPILFHYDMIVSLKCSWNF